MAVELGALYILTVKAGTKQDFARDLLQHILFHSYWVRGRPGPARRRPGSSPAYSATVPISCMLTEGSHTSTCGEFKDLHAPTYDRWGDQGRRILEVGEAWASMHTSGSMRPLADSLSDELPELQDVAHNLDTFRLGHAKGPAREVLNKVQDDTVGPLVAVAHNELTKTLEWACQSTSFSRRQFEMAKQLLEAGSTSMGILLLFESVLTAVCGSNADDRSSRTYDHFKNESRDDFNNFKRMRRVRNALAHGQGGQVADVQRILQSRETLDEFARDMLKWTSNIV